MKSKESTYKQAAPTLLQGGTRFLDALEKDLKKASHFIAIQVMSFEADQAGQGIIELLSNYPQTILGPKDQAAVRVCMQLVKNSTHCGHCFNMHKTRV